MRRLALTAFIIFAAGLLGPTTASAQEQPPSNLIPSVGVKPATSNVDDPNAGQWFYMDIAPGRTSTLEAILTNPATIDQQVRMSVADLYFAEDGTPDIIEPAKDVGTWATFPERTVTVPKQGLRRVHFDVTVPAGAEPGDHVGVFVVDSVATERGQNQVGVIRRVATRMYVTVPGDARPDFQIQSKAATADTWWWPKSMKVDAVLRNTGRVSLRPKMTVNDQPMTGPSRLVTNSVERYTAAVNIPWYGGYLRYNIRGTSEYGVGRTEQGPTRDARVTRFLFPWHLLVALILLTAVVWVIRKLWRGRNRKFTDLQSDLHRLERLLSSSVSSAAEREPAAPEPEEPQAWPDIEGLIKRAKRAGDGRTVERLEQLKQ